jgi:hypothetical protein
VIKENIVRGSSRGEVDQRFHEEGRKTGDGIGQGGSDIYAVKLDGLIEE